MVISHHTCYAHPLPKNHRFPMEKYDLLQGQDIQVAETMAPKIVETVVSSMMLTQVEREKQEVRRARFDAARAASAACCAALSAGALGDDDRD